MQWLAQDLGGATTPGIEKTTGVCGGAARILRTRIPVWVLEQARRLGTSEADILRCYPTAEQRAVLTLNRKDFIRLHQQSTGAPRPRPVTRRRRPASSDHIFGPQPSWEMSRTAPRAALVVMAA
ncbi:DUF433 domain-containing protein [uncultured Thiohalocapsa sp.]|uniref:DUF433 domain-containing protein n=1 Tax=uncultured Thiohalocapsa sp. TaxID=768990 RepID=UPI00345C9440